MKKFSEIANKIFDFIMFKCFKYAFTVVMLFMVIMLIISLIKEGYTLMLFLGLIFGIAVLCSSIWFNFIKKD